MSPARRNFFVLGGVGAAAAIAGGMTGALLLQSRSGAASLLASSFPDSSGRIWRLSELQGQPLVCNFWATWCEPCREELPLLDRIFAENEAKGLKMVGIAVDNSSNVQNFSRTITLRFPLLVGGTGVIELMRQLGNTAGALPFTVLLDTAGRLRRRKLGAYTAPELSADLEALIR